MSKPSLSFTLVLVAGSIDREQSLKSATDALDAHIAEHDTQQETIAAAVKSVFDEYKGANLTMPTIEGMTLRALNAQPANYKVLGEKVLNYVRANADATELKDKKTGKVLRAAEPARTRTFGISKGKNGGVCRWSDVPVGAEPASDESDSSDE